MTPPEDAPHASARDGDRPTHPLGASHADGSIPLTDGGTTATVAGDPSPDPSDYKQMLEDLDTAIEECRYKIEEGRVRTPEKEHVRQSWCKTLAYIVNIRRQVTTDRDLEEIQARLEAAGIDVP